jgi:hypothetical protein
MAESLPVGAIGGDLGRVRDLAMVGGRGAMVRVGGSPPQCRNRPGAAVADQRFLWVEMRWHQSRGVQMNPAYDIEARAAFQEWVGREA